MHRRPPGHLVALALSLLLLAASCTTDQDAAAELAVVGDVVAPTATPLPTTAPVAVPTPSPTRAPARPATAPLPSAIASPTSLPTATSAPIATAVAAATPTVAPQPTSTAAPAPTATSEPAPTPTPDPTSTAVPTATPEPTPEPAGEGGPPASHAVTDLGYVPLGQAGLVTILVPAARVELIGFHEASHPGSQAINAALTGHQMMVLDSRGRGTPARSAADIVLPPGEPLRSPVTGTVISATSYVLYCEHQDKLVYIEPDGLPGWQVRLFHVQGETPPVGTRVVAGETIVASGGANVLPFESQVDEFTAEPSWPHVHLEVVDTSVPDDRPPGGGC